MSRLNRRASLTRSRRLEPDLRSPEQVFTGVRRLPPSGPKASASRKRYTPLEMCKRLFGKATTSIQEHWDD